MFITFNIKVIFRRFNIIDALVVYLSRLSFSMVFPLIYCGIRFHLYINTLTGNLFRRYFVITTIV